MFVWTQLKINKIFAKQERGAAGRAVYMMSDCAEDRKNLIKTSITARKRHTIEINGAKLK